MMSRCLIRARGMVQLLPEIGKIQGSKKLEMTEDIKSSLCDINLRFQLDIQVDMSIGQLHI